MISGGCLCGDVRYETDQPAVAQAVCHCSHCQKQSGSAFSVLLAVAASALRVSGDPKCYKDRGDSGGEVDRFFCSRCGSPLYSALPASPKLVFIKAGTLDDVTDLAPKVHVWCDSAWPWTRFDAEDVKIARNG